MPSSNAGGSKNPSLQNKQRKKYQQNNREENNFLRFEVTCTASYSALIPSQTVVRSSCTLGLDVSTARGNTSVSKRPMHFLSKGCRGSKSVALLHTSNTKNKR